MSTDSALKAAETKWAHLLSPTVDEQAFVPRVCLFMESQARHLSSLEESAHKQINERYGSDEQIIAAAGASFLYSPIWYVASVQPLVTPVGKLVALMPKPLPPDPSGIPTISMNIESREAEVRTRTLRVACAENVTQLFDRAFDEIAREIIGNLLVAALPLPEPPSPRSLREDLTWASYIVHKNTQRAPANFVVVPTDVLQKLTEDKANFRNTTGVLDEIARTAHGHEPVVRRVGTYGERLHIIHDPLFPADQILMGYVGPSPFDAVDAGYVWGPMYFGFHADSACGTRMQVRFGQRLFRSEHYALIRRV